MDKWVRLNAELADARHYADDVKEENAALRAKLDAVPRYVRYLFNWRAGDGVVLDFDEWYAFVTTPEPDTDTSADGLVIPDDGGDE